MNFSIRECKISDADAIYLLNKNEMRYDYPSDKTRQKLALLLSRIDNKIFVAEYDGKVVGYIHANDYDVIYAEHVKNIMGIAVLNEYKKMGIGKALLFEVEKWAKQTGTAAIRLVSGKERTLAHEFYRHCGFLECKEQINFKKIL